MTQRNTNNINTKIKIERIKKVQFDFFKFLIKIVMNFF